MAYNSVNICDFHQSSDVMISRHASRCRWDHPSGIVGSAWFGIPDSKLRTSIWATRFRCAISGRRTGWVTNAVFSGSI